MAESKTEKFKEALMGAQVPTLVLDNKWHRLLKRTNGNTKEIAALEKELTDLLKRQGKLNNDIRALKKIKTDLMNEIVSNMDDKKSDKKIKDNKNYIAQANDKMDSYEDELLELPREIDRVNKELMLKTMEICYECLQENTDEIEKIANWIRDIRIELKRNVIKKQEIEMTNADLYTFMHNIFGHDVMDLFDMRYEPKIRIPEQNKSESSDKNE